MIIDRPPHTRIRVVHLIQDLAIGGLERIVSTIAQSIDKDRFDIKVWCLAAGGDVYRELQAKGVSCAVLHMGSHRNPLFYARLARQLRANRTQIVHTHGYTANTVGRLAACCARIPVVIAHLHSNYSWYRPKQKFIDRFLSRCTARIICCSRSVAAFARDDEKIPAEKLCVIYNGVDLERFRNEPKAAGSPFFVVGCVASLTPHKGHTYLLQAIAQQRRAGRAVKLVLAGAGRLEAVLKKQACALGIDDCVEFKGVVTDTAPLIAGFDAAVLPSVRYEGLGLALVEAMAAGVPVVGTKVGGIPEVITDQVNGLLVKPADADALAQAIGALAADPVRARAMGEAGRQKAEKEFSCRGMIEEIERLYTDLVTAGV